MGQKSEAERACFSGLGGLALDEKSAGYWLNSYLYTGCLRYSTVPSTAFITHVFFDDLAVIALLVHLQ